MQADLALAAENARNPAERDTIVFRPRGAVRQPARDETANRGAAGH